jgi:putative membrane protein insertion efficiency factor
MKRSLAARAALGLIALYQGLRAGRPSPCRFYPSCSTYAQEAIETHGFGRGGWLAARRLARCHPLGGRGIDLVPVRTEEPGR